MIKIKILLLLGLLTLSINTFSQIKIFISAKDANGVFIPGESTYFGYEGNIEAHSFGQENNICNSSSIPCPAKAGRFSFALDMNIAIPHLRRNLFKAEKLQSMTVIFTKLNSSVQVYQEIYRIKLENVYIATATDGYKNGTTSIITTFDVNADRIGWTYLKYNSAGNLSSSTKFGWNTVSNDEWTGF
jgi:type VI protein secretion system component Hcp